MRARKSLIRAILAGITMPFWFLALDFHHGLLFQVKRLKLHSSFSSLLPAWDKKKTGRGCRLGYPWR